MIMRCGEWISLGKCKIISFTFVAAVMEGDFIISQTIASMAIALISRKKRSQTCLEHSMVLKQVMERQLTQLDLIQSFCEASPVSLKALY